MLPETIGKAIKRAQAIITESLPESGEKELREELKSLSKKELIDRVVELSVKKPAVSIEDIAYKILSDPDCAWLTWEMVASIMKSKIPNSSTSAQSLRWYSSKAAEKGQRVVPRVRSSAIAKLLSESMSEE